MHSFGLVSPVCLHDGPAAGFDVESHIVLVALGGGREWRNKRATKVTFARIVALQIECCQSASPTKRRAGTRVPVDKGSQSGLMVEPFLILS